jgi:hypothetical protein
LYAHFQLHIIRIHILPKDACQCSLDVAAITTLYHFLTADPMLSRNSSRRRRSFSRASSVVSTARRILHTLQTPPPYSHRTLLCAALRSPHFPERWIRPGKARKGRTKTNSSTQHRAAGLQGLGKPHPRSKTRNKWSVSPQNYSEFRRGRASSDLRPSHESGVPGEFRIGETCNWMEVSGPTGTLTSIDGREKSPVGRKGLGSPGEPP